MSYLLAIDQSTSGTKALLFDTQGNILDRTDCAHAPHYPQPGWVEHDAEEIYRNVLTVLSEMAQRQTDRMAEVACLSITNQRETVVVFDHATGKPLHPAIVWQCQRGTEVCAEFAECRDTIRAITGLSLNTYFPAPKLRRLFREQPELARRVQDGSAIIGTIDAYLIYRLTNGKVFATDATNASRTLLYDIRRHEWSGDLCTLFGIPCNALPEVRACDATYGETDAEGALPKPLPIAGVIGDSQAALFAQRCFTPGSAKATMGTGSSLLMNVANLPHLTEDNGIVAALAWDCVGKVQYALEGIIPSAGATLQWLRDQLGLITDAAECETLSASVADNGGAYFVPAFSGLGAPYWAAEARAGIVGLTTAHTRAHVVRAALEAVAYQIADSAAALTAASGQSLHELQVDGGMTTNHFLMQFLADITGCTLRVSSQPELSATGAVYMGMLALGLQPSLTDLENLPRRTCEYTPALCRSEVGRYCAGWHKAVHSVIHA
jgi:glycerol kinase